MEFESPFISLRTMSNCEIVIRKNYWDIQYDLDLMQDRIAMNLLYIQATSDVEEGWVTTNAEIRQKLSSLPIMEYMALVRTLPFYGCLHFSNVNCNFPDTNSTATIILGNSELVIKTAVGVNQYQETKFRVTRMRSWRITTICNSTDKEALDRINFELSFEYLMAKNCLKWIKLVTEQATLISICLQVSLNVNALYTK
jgi:sorting nexin-17